MERTTIYLDEKLRKALQLKAVQSEQSMSALVNDAIRLMLAEDADDLAVGGKRIAQAERAFETVLKDLKRDGLL